MKKWIKLLFVILLFASISLVVFLVLRAFNITNIETLRRLIAKSGNWGVLTYTLISSLLLVCLCFIPLLNTSLIVLGITIFGSTTAFITNIIAVFISSTLLFVVGDKFGERFAAKLVGKNTLEETQNKIDHKSKFWLPIIFITPGIPDEAICLVAGMTKMKYLYLISISIIYHAIEIGIFCFIGSGLITWSALSLIDWIIVINLLIIDIFALLKLEKHLSQKTKKK